MAGSSTPDGTEQNMTDKQAAEAKFGLNDRLMTREERSAEIDEIITEDQRRYPEFYQPTLPAAPGEGEVLSTSDRADLERLRAWECKGLMPLLMSPPSERQCQAGPHTALTTPSVGGGESR